MSDEKVKRTGILPSDIDAAGNVTLWDHGPGDYVADKRHTDDVNAALAARHDGEVQAWHDLNGDGPISAVMHSSDAGHALMIDPDRFALEPDDLDEGEIKKRMDEMREKREAAARAPQDAIDRRVAIAAIISDRANAKATEKAPEKAKPVSKPSVDLAAEQRERDRVAAEQKASHAAAAERERLAREKELADRAKAMKDQT